MTKLYRFFSLIISFLLLLNNGFAQDIFKGNDLSQVNVEKLSDADILRYQSQLKTSGLSQDQAEKLALSKGFPASQLTLLHQRIQAMTANAANNSATPAINTREEQEQPTSDMSAGNLPIDPRIFGAQLFSNASLTFQPDLKIATPVNYQLGPDDQLQIAVFGLQEASFNLTISPEGTIYIPNVGEVQVSGLTVEEARDRIRNRMSSIYTSLRSGNSKLSINLGKIRSIRVTVLGSNKPGTFTISSLSTLFNALYISGGPSPNGSFREIELLRNNKIEKKIDLYNFLLSGNENDNIRLRENDIIRIPVYKNRVEIAGEVKHPGIFEILPGETVSDLIRFASGFTDSAYRASIKVIQLTNIQRKIKDLGASEFSQYHPLSADYFSVSKILNRFQNRIRIEGAVARPGDFELTENLQLSQLIKRADGLREDAYTGRGQIIRLKEDLSSEIIPFNLASVLNGTNDIILKREDRIIIASLFDLKDEFNVLVQGEVRRPATYKYIEGLSLKDILLQAGGFTDAAFPQRIEIARVIRRDTLTVQDRRLSQIIDIKDISDLDLNSNSVSLQPFDVITVRRLPGYLPLSSVNATGEVQFPGPYVLQNRLERVSDLLKRAGGFTPEAFADAAYLRRLNEHNVTTDIKAGTVNKIQQQLKDSSGAITGSVQRSYDQIPLDLRKILSYPGSTDDIILKPGDELFIPRNDEQIKITGEVLFPTQTPFTRSKTLKDYVRDAGGFTDNARRKRSYVLYPNGKAAATHHFLFFRNYPDIKPGSEIIVPKYIVKEKNRRSTTEVVALSSAVASLVYVVIAIFRL